MLKKRVTSLFLVCVMLFSLLPVPVRAEDELPQPANDSSVQEVGLVRIAAEDGSYALEPIANGQYMLWIYEDPFFETDALLNKVQAYWDSITVVHIGEGIMGLCTPGSNPFSVLNNLSAFEVDADNMSYAAIDGALFTSFSGQPAQLTAYPSAKATPLTLPASTVFIDAAALEGVEHAEINVPADLELDAESPVTIDELTEKSNVTIRTIPTNDVESVAIWFEGEPISSLPELDADDTRSLTAHVEPAGALPDVTWSSDDESVATVSSDGTVTAVGRGSAVITATTVGLKGTEHLSASCTVQARPRVTSVAITNAGENAALIPGGSLTLSASVTPADANQSLIWHVSDADVLALSGSTGSAVTVTALSAGTATVTVASARYDTIMDTCAITVSIPVTGITLDTDDFTLNLTNPVSETRQLTAAVQPENASDQRFSWSSSDESVAAVSPTGLVSAVSKGLAVITATTADGGFTASCLVTVQEVDVAGLVIAPATLNLRVDPSLPTARYGQLSVVHEPECATHQDVTWASFDPEIATVDQTGKVTAVSNGEVYIIATSRHGADGISVTAQCKVTVEMGATSISIPEELELSLNKEGADSQARLAATVEPANSTDALNWASSNESVATVDSNGTVTAVSEGSATITAACGSVKATCAVTVTDYQVKRFDVLPQNVRVKVDETETISAKLGPSHATDKAIVWTIDNSEVASLSAAAVAADGTSTITVQGLKVGTATVTAASADNGAVVAACTVTVPEVKIESLRLDSQTLTLYRNTPDGKSADFPSTAALTLTISPADTTNDVVWTGSSGAVTLGSAQYETHNNVKTGTVTLTAASSGTSVITAAADGQAAQCAVKVVVLATGVTLSKSALELVKDTSATVIATVLPNNVDNSAVTWASSNNQVATVDANGVVTAVAASGTATITATAKDGSGVHAACTVTAKPIPASGITLDAASITLEKGESKVLSATVTPPSVTDGSVQWTSADEAIAKVDANGKVTAVNGGDTTITAATADGKFRASCEVTVTVALTGLTLNRDVLTIQRAENSANTGTLIATVTPADTTAGNVIWASSDPDIVAVESSSAIDKTTGESRATLSGKKAGIATVTAWIGNYSRTCIVTVEQPSGRITLDRTALSLGLHKSGIADSGTLRATVEPADSTDALVWSSNNESVATVDQNGVVTAISAGSATITVTGGSVSAECRVTVTDYQITALRMESELTVYLNGTAAKPSEKTLTLTIEPFDTQDAVTWSNGNPDAVTLGTPGETSDESSKTCTVTVTAKGVGKAVITATAANGVTARCTVTVEDLSVKSVNVTPKRLILQKGDVSEALRAVIEPSAAANTSVTWRSTDSTVATVDGGVVNAVGVGEAEIIVTTADGGKTDVCYVTVKAKPVETLTLSKRSIDVFFRDAEQRTQILTATIAPDDATDMRVIWTSSNESVATVVGSNDGAASITLHAAGSAVITATSASSSAVSATCAVTVRATRVAGIRLDKSSLELNPLENDTLAATLTSDSDGYEPDNTTVTWTSSDASVAAVDSNGKVSAVAAGTTVITACTEDGGFVATCVVRVWRKVTGVSLNTNSLNLNVGERRTLTATVSPSTAANKAVTWASSNPGVVTVDAGGNVAALAAGETTITVTTEDQGFAATCTVTVSSVAVSSVALNETALTLLVNDVRTLTAAVSPDNATNKSVAWTSDKPEVVSVVDGKVTAKTPGTATVTAAADGKSAACEITVYAAVTGVSISGDGTLTLSVGDDETLTATVAPAGEADSRVTWASSDGSVATVDNNGKVSAVAPGVAVITAASVASPGKQAFRTVKVVQPATGVTLSASSLSFDLSTENKSAELTAAITPSDTTDPVTWTVADSSVAQISAPSTASGSSSVTVYALKAGSTTVTVTCGEQSATCTVTVAKPVTGVSITEEALSFDLTMGSTLTLHAALEPNGAAEAVTWRSGNTAVAAVSARGVVTPVAPGTTFIEAATADGGYSDSRIVTVKQLATGITLSPATLSLPVGRTAELTAALLGDPTNPSVNWSVSGAAVRVSDNGVVTAEAAGTATVTAAAADGSGVSKSCIVTVYEPVTAVAIQKDGSPVSSLSLTMVTDPTAQLSAVTTGGSGVSVVWSSSSDSVATVDSSGLVSAASAGTAMITVTATTGDVSVSKSCTVTVRKAVISADTTTMTLTPAHNAANVVFSPWAAGTSLTWNVSGSGITRAEGALNDSDKTYTISSLNNGVTTVSWSKAEDARYEASSGEITVFSVYNPITAVSVDRSKLATGCALTASIDQANRMIRVAGYVSGNAEDYSLDGKLIFTPAAGVIDGLSVTHDVGTVTAKLNESAICTYTLDRGGIVSLPDTVNVKTTLVAEENASVSSVNLTNANISGEAAAVSAATTAAGARLQEAGEVDVTVEVILSPVKETSGTVAGYNTVTLDITPQYTITSQEDGALIDSGTLSELPSAITIQVETAFQPSLIVHKHEDSVEYIPFTCIGPNENGLYTVSWQQSTFSEVEFLDEAAARQYLAEQAKADESATPAADKPMNPAAGGGIAPAGCGGAPAGGAPAAAGGAQPAPAETAPKAFADVSPSHWAADAIAYASAHGLMNGMGDGSFAPEAAASRAMIAQILFNLTPDKAAGARGFADAAGTWYDEAARWAASCGIVTGIDGSFRGGDAITREQLVTMLYRYAQFTGRDVSTEALDYDRFTDAASVSPWASDAMRWAVGCGLIQGIGDTLSPDTGATRAQIAMILMRFCETALQ